MFVAYIAQFICSDQRYTMIEIEAKIAQIFFSLHSQRTLEVFDSDMRVVNGLDRIPSLKTNKIIRDHILRVNAWVCVCIGAALKCSFVRLIERVNSFFFLFSPLNLSCYPHWMYGCMSVCVYVALCITLLIRLIQSGPKEVKQLLFMLKACVIWQKTRECMGVFQHKIHIKISNIFWCVICRWSFFLARLISWSDLIGRARGVPINTISIHTFVS